MDSVGNQLTGWMSGNNAAEATRHRLVILITQELQGAKRDREITWHVRPADMTGNRAEHQSLLGSLVSIAEKRQDFQP